MLFEIHCENCDENEAVLKSLEEFHEGAKGEWKEEMDKAKAKLKTIKSISIFGMPEIPLPDEVVMIYWEENGIVFFRLAVYMPKVLKIMGKHRGLEKTLRLFLEAKGHKIKKIRYTGD
jgi:hypothetical protein